MKMKGQGEGGGGRGRGLLETRSLRVRAEMQLKFDHPARR
jgi:hypothetical protein